MRNIMSVDVEDYFSLVARDQAALDLPVSGYVESETRRLLEVLADLGILATCFVVGRVAYERPRLIREIVNGGHEVASHGFDHIPMDRLSPRAFEGDLRRSIVILEDATGLPVRGFRAPAFSLTERHLWAFDIMADQGITFDSSVRIVWPSVTERTRLFIRRAAAFGIREIPGFAMGMGRLRIPVAGGGGLRIPPRFVTRWSVRKINRYGFPVPLYLHPYDLTMTSYPWPRSTILGRLRIFLFDRSQRLGRRRILDHLRAANEVGGTGTIGTLLAEAVDESGERLKAKHAAGAVGGGGL